MGSAGTISGPFFFGSLVGVGCPKMVVGSRLGTLAGTFQLMPTCALSSSSDARSIYLVPFVEDEQTVFLKTIIPSRKATKEYLGEETDDEA